MNGFEENFGYSCSWRTLEYSWLRYFSKSKEFLSDNALEFTLNEFKILCDRLHIKYTLGLSFSEPVVPFSDKLYGFFLLENLSIG